MKKHIPIIIMLLNSCIGFAQTESIDLVTYKPIKGWKKERTDKSVSFSKTDEAKGTFCIITIYPSLDGNTDSKTNFDNSWQKIVQEPLSAAGPKMEAPGTENGWELQTGAAQFDKDGISGTAMLVTATCQNKMVNMLVLLNADIYAKQLYDFIGSVELKKIEPQTGSAEPPSGNAANSSIVGMWVFYNTESSGTYNGFPQLTGGYMRREYVFYGDGTYIFRSKDLLISVKDILFVYETGTYIVNANQITITPKNGKGEWWSKRGRTSEWGKLVRSSTDYKLEKTTYTFNFDKYIGGSESTLILKSAKPTKREGSNGDNAVMQEYRYNSRDINNSLIDTPPGFKNNELTTTPATKTNNTEQEGTK